MFTPRRWLDRAHLSVRTELTLAEAEQAQREQLVAESRTVPDATRDLFPHEITAQVRFADLDAQAEQAAALILRAWTQLREQTLDALAADLATRADVLAAVLLRIGQLRNGVGTLPVEAVAAEAAQAISTTLAQLADWSADELVREAVRQGVAAWELPAPASQVRSLMLDAWAEQVTGHAISHALDRAARAATDSTAGPDEAVADEVVGKAREGSMAAGEDVSRRAAGQGAAAGREVAAQAGPQPRTIYASELLDRNTCLPCSHVDGRQYASMAAAFADYPGAGAYRACEGGTRCRGTLVYVWNEEPASR